MTLSRSRRRFAFGAEWSNDLGDIAAYYRGQELLMERWEDLEIPPIFELDYEELVSEPERVIPGLIALCGLDWAPRCLRPHENPRPVLTASYDQVRRSICRSSAGRSTPYTEALRPFERALEAAAELDR